MTERAEGFWWVRWKAIPIRDHATLADALADDGWDGAWEAAEVMTFDEHSRTLGMPEGFGVRDGLCVRTRKGTADVEAPLLVWGPYLGKEPGDVTILPCAAATLYITHKALDAAAKAGPDVLRMAVETGAERFVTHTVEEWQARALGPLPVDYHLRFHDINLPDKPGCNATVDLDVGLQRAHGRLVADVERRAGLVAGYALTYGLEVDEVLAMTANGSNLAPLDHPPCGIDVLPTRAAVLREMKARLEPK